MTAPSPAPTAHRTLITGGARSGKSVVAEHLLSGVPQVACLLPGPIPNAEADPEWAARIAIHQARRPAHWLTVETSDLATGIAEARGAVLIDCLGTWVTAVMDELQGWDAPESQWRNAFDARLAGFIRQWTLAAGPLVAVTNEVGMGLVPDYKSGRLFRDLLGTVNQAVAAASDDVLLVVAGRTLRL
ncbi:bifunctional adenosylcobinamide kinase/adenosylcobinamide-phosphate guanylyltransferase [Nakamurella antarctica]|uniref:Adenosylcobinamide kinase n=1 Tax=Nakamurella antarctica TaxID=1902245 RepID=A0A3G8ZQB9_9ACTN|nr:bifunctional adenosylcobinamide kinase/adenosylcobinamide-phosphate guanylyltransferase [Nakamurella antarctica]AZI58995.1 bifunctional adenosylcobinamide kinase/adenosylcobinamide-phosphate guanylyltransferase [Nakamurella antarctica]